MTTTRLDIIKGLSQQIADICDMPTVPAMAWERITELQGEIEHQINLSNQEFEAENEAQIQAECNAGARALRAICTQEWAS